MVRVTIHDRTNDLKLDLGPMPASQANAIINAFDSKPWDKAGFGPVNGYQLYRVVITVTDIN